MGICLLRRRELLAILGGAPAAWLLAARAHSADGRLAALPSRILRLRADAAAAKIGQFITEIVNQVGWTIQLPGSVGTMDQRRFDALRLLRQVPAVTELAFLDASGTELLKVSRLVMDRVANKADLSQDPKFTEAVAHKVYFGPVYLAHRSDIHMVLSLAGTRRESVVSLAEISLMLVWDIIQQLRVSEHGVAYVLDSRDRCSRLRHGPRCDSGTRHQRARGAHRLRAGDTRLADVAAAVARLALVRGAAGRRGRHGCSVRSGKAG